MTPSKIRTWMTPHPITVPPGESVLAAYTLMKRHRIRRLPVVADGQLVGILTINDIRSVAPMGELSYVEHNRLLEVMPVRSAMTPNPFSISPDASVGEAARLLMQHKIGGLPVVENGRVVGVISEADIFRRTIAETWSPGAAPAEDPGREQVTLPDGAQVCIRPITPDDAPRLQHAHEQLSQETVYDRFMGFRKILPDEEARYLSGLDYDRHMALIATAKVDGQEVIVGVARYILIESEPGLAEFAIVVGDPYQRRGLGTLLLNRLAGYAAAHGVRTFLGLTHADNVRFLRFVQRLGLPQETRKVDGMWEVRLALAQPHAEEQGAQP